MIEILLVVSLMAVITIALARGLISGVRLWEQSLYADRLIDVSILFDKMERDLRQSFNYSVFPFEGKSTEFTFPTIVNVPADPRIPELDGQMVLQPGRVHYEWDRLKKTIVRHTANYGQAFEDELGEAQIVAEGIQSFRLRYYYASEELQPLVLKAQGLEHLPALIEMEIELEDRTGRGVRLQRYFDLPAGSAGPRPGENPAGHPGGLT